MIRTRVLRAAFLLLSCSSFAAAFQQSIAGSRWFSRSARHSPSRLLAKEESEENFWTLLNPFSQAPSATKREKEEYKRAEKGSTPKTTAESKYHMGESRFKLIQGEIDYINDLIEFERNLGGADDELDDDAL